jgi:hypothetical protein
MSKEMTDLFRIAELFTQGVTLGQVTEQISEMETL